MDPSNVEATSQAKMFGKAEATWKIVDWTGALSSFMLSEAECFVSVPSADDASSNIQLRFHLAPYKSHVEPNLEFCQTLKRFYHRSLKCCSTCQPGWRAIPSSIPVEVLPKSIPRSAGYSLLVDVLSAPTDKLGLNVSVTKLNGDGLHGPNDNFVILGSNSKRQDIPVVDSFWRTVMWNVDESGNVESFEETVRDTVNDAKIRLTISAYQMESTGTDAHIAKKPGSSEETVPAASNPTLPSGQQDLFPALPTFGGMPPLLDSATLELHKQMLQTQQMLIAEFPPAPPSLPPWLQQNPVTLPFVLETPTAFKIQQRPNGQTNRSKRNKRKSKRSNLNGTNTPNAATAPQIDVYDNAKLSAQLKKTKMADQSTATPEEDPQPSTSSDAGSDFDLIESPDKQTKTATNNEEVLKMQEDLKDLLEKLNHLKHSD